MPRLGLGLGLSRGSQLKTFAQLVKSAGGVLYLDARKADGSKPLTGNQSPFKDLSGNSNDGTLTNFAGTGTSGWQASPNVLRFDGVDDFVQFLDTVSLDIVNAPLGIGVTFKKDVADNQYMLAKNSSGNSTIQYGMLYRIANTVEFYKNGVGYAQFAVPLSKYINTVFYWDGANVTGYLNNVQKNQAALVGPLISDGTLVLGKINNLLEFSADICTFTIYTGSDINKILNAEAKISAEYLALNP